MCIIFEMINICYWIILLINILYNCCFALETFTLKACCGMLVLISCSLCSLSLDFIKSTSPVFTWPALSSFFVINLTAFVQWWHSLKVYFPEYIDLLKLVYAFTIKYFSATLWNNISIKPCHSCKGCDCWWILK